MNHAKDFSNGKCAAMAAVWRLAAGAILVFACQVGVSTPSAHAKVLVQVVQRIGNARFALGAGSQVRLDFGIGRAAADGIFLGQVVEADGASNEYLILDLNKTRAYLVDRANAQFSQPPGSTQAILRPLKQWGETCGAYAMTHFWEQFYLARLGGNQNLAAMMSSERERTRFLEQNVSQYYLGRPTQIANVMKKHGMNFGVPCRTSSFDLGRSAADFVYRQAQAGIPVLMEYYIGPNMWNSSYETVDFEKPGPVDSRLWIPRRKGERNSGGHAIVAAAGFVAHGHRKVVVIDSDWDEPRIWDIDQYLGGRTSVKDMGFTTCGALVR